MVTAPTVSMELESWIALQTEWREFAHAQIVVVPASDPDLVQFLTAGSLAVHTGGTRTIAETFAILTGLDNLRGQLLQYIASAVTPFMSARHKSLPTVLNVYSFGAWRLADENKLALLVSLDEPPVTPFPLGIEQSEALQDLLDEHHRNVADWEAEKAAKEAHHREQCEANPHYKEALEKAFIFSRAEHESRRPQVTLGALVSGLPAGTLIRGPFSKRPNARNSAIIDAVAASGFPPSRDGCYIGVTAGRKPDRRGLVTWKPNLGGPSYPEIRWAVQTVLPRAMARPRLTELGRPKLELPSTAVDASTSITLPKELEQWAEILSETPMDDTDFGQRIDQSCQDRSTKGFEAIAWFQPYHDWTEETWGIYIDSQRLDDFALSIWADCRDRRCPISFALASILAVGLINAHEMFHARVEAAASWLELNAGSPRYRRYQSDVYRALAGTSGWLEEALANWSAWDWFDTPQTGELLSAFGANPGPLGSVIEDVLDLSPHGYQDWRAGHDRETWRSFAAQLASGKPVPRPKGIALPLESVFRDPLPYDLITSDIPLWLVGPGKIADQLRSHPASFHVPSRREAVKVLRHFNHRHVPARGKGSHEQWIAPDQRGFPLPARDPLSREVFSSLLSHLGIDKKTYVQDIRPKL